MNHVLTPDQAAQLHASMHGTFDLLEWIEDLDNDRLKDSLLRAVAFSADGQINAALGKMLNDFYSLDRNKDQPEFDTYSDMLRFVESMEFSETGLEEQGFEVVHTKQRIHALADLRSTLWAVATRGAKDKIPQIQDVLANPRLRTTSSSTLAKNEQFLDLVAGDDKELRAELQKDLAIKDKLDAQRMHDFDKNRSKSLVMLFNCLNIDLDDVQDDPFRELDARSQHRLISTAYRACDRAVDDARRDNRISSVDFAALFIDVRDAKKRLQLELKHPRFADVD